MTILVAFENFKMASIFKMAAIIPENFSRGCVYIENGWNRHQTFYQSEHGIEFDIFKDPILG
jgi:hypothetical protein